MGNKITPLVINPGRIVLTSVTLYFQPYNNAEQKPVIKVKLSSIKRIFQRRYLLRPLGLEIEYINIKNKSDHIYLTFNKPEERQKLYHRLVIARQELELKNQDGGDQVFFPQNTPIGQGDAKSLSLPLPRRSATVDGSTPIKNEMDHPLSPVYQEKQTKWLDAGEKNSLNGTEIMTLTPTLHLDIKEENMTLQWQNGMITNLEYLLYLNSAADRSFNDLTQYPVMPWVIQDYKSTKIDLSDTSIYRDLSKPMGALDEERLKSLKNRTCDMPEPRFLYGSHYSTPGFVLHFLARKIPECMLCLQNGRFDHPDRMFNSIPQTWVNVTTHHSDFKELIPEFYLSENGDFLKNSRNIDFVIRHCGTPIGDVELPPWANSPEEFVQTLRKAIESEYVSKNIHLWIDLIFGYKQRGKNADLANNLFYHLCYEGSVDLDKIQDLEQRYALEIQIGEFGQVPKQLFTSPHPQRNWTPTIGTVLNNNIDKISGDMFRKRHNRTPSEGKFTLKNLWGALDVYEDEPDINVSSKTICSQSMVLAGSILKTKMRMVCDYCAHREGLSTVAVSADKLWIFSASHDNILKMYSLEEMSLLRNVSIGTVTNSSSSKGDDTALTAQKIENNKFPPSAISITCCFPLPNNKTILIGSRDHSICVYSIEYGRTYEFNNAHRDVISCIDWQNGLLATGSWDGCVKVWHCTEVNGYVVNADADYFVAVLDHTSQVSAVALCPNNSRQLVAGTRDGNVILWCLNSGAQIQELPSHTRQVNGVRFSPDAKRVVSCGSDFFLKVIDIKTGCILFSKDLGEELHCLAFDGRIVLAGGASGQLSLWDIHTVKFCGKIAAHKGPVTSLWVSEDGEIIATGGEDRRVVVWTTRTAGIGQRSSATF